jgi:CheY-like chemotaxis protein
MDAHPPRFSGRVLVVEDNAINQLVASEMLQALGIEVAVANDGLEALERLSHEQYDLVLMDCMMPKLDGYEAVRRWRAHEAEHASAHLPIAALTANATPADRHRCFEAGMDEHLAKPIAWAQLVGVLQRFLPAAQPTL